MRYQREGGTTIQRPITAILQSSFHKAIQGPHRVSDFSIELPVPESASVAQMVTKMPTMHRPEFNSWVRKIPWRRARQSSPVFLSGECHGQRSLVGYIPWGCKESDTTEQLTLSLSFTFRARFNPRVSAS